MSVFALFFDRPGAQAVIVSFDQAAAMRHAAQRLAPFAVDLGRLLRRRRCQPRNDQSAAVLEGVLQIVGKIFCCLGPSPEVHAPFAAAVGDQNAAGAQLVHDLHNQRGDAVAGHSLGLRQNRPERQRREAESGLAGALQILDPPS